MFKKPMKMRDLEIWGVPSYMVDIWEKSYSPYLLTVQEEAVRYYGVLDYTGGNDRNNLLVIAPTSSGKTFIGEMGAITQVIHKKKILYLVPLKTLAEEKYQHFKRLYSNCGIDITISSRDRKEDDKKISRGKFQVAIMVYEKFYYFFLKYPSFLSGISLVVIDELQLINDPERGPLLEEMLVHLQKQEPKIKIISLSAFLENQEAFLNWFPSRLLTSYQRPVELRKGIVREGVFKYVTHNEKKFGEEVFFPPQAVSDNCREDYVLETVRYFILHHEPTLLFFPTKSESRKWAEWLADSLAAIAEDSGWSKGREKDVKKIRRLSERMVEGVEEDGLALARLYIPGLSRYYIGKLVREGYNDERCLEEVTEEELGRVLPERLVKRIKSRIKEEKENQEAKRQKLKANNSNQVVVNNSNAEIESEHRKLTTMATATALKTETGELQPETILEIDLHRPDRIIFQRKEIKVTAKEFSLIHLLTQHPEQVMSYDELLDKLWKDEEDAIYNRVSFHLSKVRRTILKIIGESKINKEKIKNIFTVVSKRGIMLKLKADQIKIN